MHVSARDRGVEAQTQRAVAEMSVLLNRLFAVGSEIAAADSLLDHGDDDAIEHAVHDRLERAVLEIDEVIADLRCVVVDFLEPPRRRVGAPTVPSVQAVDAS